jgi:hypothetical protein
LPWNFICPLRDFFINYSWSILEIQHTIYFRQSGILNFSNIFWFYWIYDNFTLDYKIWSYFEVHNLEVYLIFFGSIFGQHYGITITFPVFLAIMEVYQFVIFIKFIGLFLLCADISLSYLLYQVGLLLFWIFLIRYVKGHLSFSKYFLYIYLVIFKWFDRWLSL